MEQMGMIILENFRSKKDGTWELPIQTIHRPFVQLEKRIDTIW